MIKSGITVRKAGEILELSVSSLYYHCIKVKQDKAVADMIGDIAFKYTFYGYRRINAVIQSQGIVVNHKKIYRIYRSLNLQRQKPKRKKKLITVEYALIEALYCNHIWAVDFLFDAVLDGRIIKILTVEDIFSRFSLGIDCGFSIPAKVVIEVLKDCIGLYGIPGIIRTDQGSEFRSLTFERFIQKYGIRHEFTEKGSPWQNGMIESFNGKLRDECLNRNLFENLTQ